MSFLRRVREPAYRPTGLENIDALIAQIKANEARNPNFYRTEPVPEVTPHRGYFFNPNDYPPLRSFSSNTAIAAAFSAHSAGSMTLNELRRSYTSNVSYGSSTSYREQDDHA